MISMLRGSRFLLVGMTMFLLMLALSAAHVAAQFAEISVRHGWANF
jgi:hypothetical protein